MGDSSQPAQRLSVLLRVLSTVRNHKKKTILLLFILSCYLGWKLRAKIPYQKIIQKVMGRIMEAMDKQMKHQQFMENKTISLNVCLSEFEKGALLSSLPGHYNGMFEIAECRDELRNKAKELSKDRKTEIWQKLIDEVVLFVFFSLIVTRQRTTVEMLKKTLIAKYRENLATVLGEDVTQAQSLLEDLLTNYFNSSFDEKNVLLFLRENLVHDIKPTSSMDFFEVKKNLTKLLTSCAFATTTSSNRKRQQASKKAPKTKTKLISSKDKNIQKLFWDSSDPTHESPSLISKVYNGVKRIGQFILPNMYPESLHLTPPPRNYQLLQLLFGTNTENAIADMENNKAIAEAFRERTKRQKAQQQEQELSALDNQEEDDDNSSDQMSEKINKNDQNDTQSNMKQPEKSKVEEEKTTQQGKTLCTLILKELRDILDMSSMNTYFYYSCLFDLRKFLNRLLLLLHKKKELGLKQPFAKFSVYLDKLVLEEFLRPDAEQNNQGFYDVRIKKCFGLIKSSHPRQQQHPQQHQLGITNGSSDPSTQEALELSSSGENNLFQNSQEPPVVEPLEYLINLNVLQEIEQHQIVEDALKEIIKRIFFEREQSTVSFAPVVQQKNQPGDDAQGGGQGLGQLLNMLGGGAPGAGGQDGGDIMSLLSRI